MASSLSPAAVSSIMAGPAATPPPGVVPNFQNPPNHRAEGRAWMIIGLILMVIPLIMRLFTQAYISRKFVLEDYFIAIAATLSVGVFVPLYMTMSTIHACGYHMWDITAGEFFQNQQYVNDIEIGYDVVVTLVKLAILRQILRIFVPIREGNPVLWFSCWALFIITSIFYTIIMFFEIFQCWPRNKIWNPFTPGHCISFTKQVITVSSIFNVATDLIILLLPLPTIYKLNVDFRKKLLIGGVFATGGLACVVSALRLYYSCLVVYGNDISWNYLPLGVTAFFEDVIGIVVFCLPTGPKFVRFIKEALRKWRAKRSDSAAEGLQPNGQEAPRGRRRHWWPETAFFSSIRQYIYCTSHRSSEVGDDVHPVFLEGGAQDLGNWKPSNELLDKIVVQRSEDVPRTFIHKSGDEKLTVLHKSV